MSALYLIALGSNMRVPGTGGPRLVLDAALAALESETVHIRAAAPVIESVPLGPSIRRYANGAAIIETLLSPLDLLALLHGIERSFGRDRAQRRGQRWRSRALDLDIILWSGGVVATPGLTIPHREMRQRAFVLGPACAIAHDWRDPVTGLRLGHLRARLMRKEKGAQPRRG